MKQSLPNHGSPDIAARTETRTGGRPATTATIAGDFALSVGMPDRPAPDGWRWTKITDVARLETGHTPSRKHPEYWGGEVPWIGIKDATGNHGRTICNTIQHTNELGIANSSARILPANTVCLSRTASVGYVVVMGRPMATSQDFVNWVCSPELDHRFLKYVLLSERSAFLRFASGTTHQTIYFPEVKAFHVGLPSPAEQRAIADILGTLDDKIELNRRTNATLETMARAIFKDWFVDFGPTRAKMEGREPYYLAPDISDLFPDRLDNEGKPEGWTNGTLADLAQLNPEVWTKDTRPETIRYVDLANTKWGRIEAIANYPRDEAPSRAQRLLRPNDTIVGTVRPGNGSFALIANDGLTGSTGFAHLRPRLPDAAEFVYLAVTSKENIKALAHLADGVAYPAVRAEVVAASPITIPSDNMLGTFSDHIQSLWAKIAQNDSWSRTLAQTRDLLLPKLISGKIRLCDAARAMETVR